MWGYVGFIGLCWLVGIGGNFLPIHRSLKSRILSLAWTNAILGIFLFFFRFEGIPLLGMDIWRLLQEILTVVWIISIIRYSRTHLKHELMSEKVTSYRQKFLPKAK